MKRKFDHVKDIYRIFTKSGAGTFAAAASYYILLSIPPFFILTADILNHLSKLNFRLEHFFKSAASREVADFLETMFQTVYTSNTVVTLPISFLILLWSSSKGTSAVISGLRTVYHLPHRGFVQNRLQGMFFILVIVPLLLIVYYTFVASYVILFIMIKPVINNSLLQYLFDHRSIIGYLLTVFLLTICYKILYRKSSISNATVSAAAASGALTLLSTFFFIYVRWTVNRKKFLSSLTILLFGAVWLRIAVLVIFYGAILNRYLVTENIHLVKRSDNK